VLTRVPPLLVGLLDDAAMLPPRGALIGDALAEHLELRRAWYAPLVGPLLVPADEVGALWSKLRDGGYGDRLMIGLVGPLTVVAGALAAAGDQVTISHIETPVAKRGEDPMPGIRAFLAVAAGRPGYAEVPLTWGLLAALDSLAEARAGGKLVAPKFRTGGLAAFLLDKTFELESVFFFCFDV
jgi:hypothetical protein